MEHSIQMEVFDSINAFVDAISTRKLNAAFKAEKCESSMDKGEFAKDWTGTYDMDEAQRLMQYGYPEGCKAILNGGGMAKHTDNRTRKQRVNDVVGGCTNIGAAVIGLPKSMIRVIPMPNKTRILNVVYDCGACSSVDMATMARGGANMMAFVKHMENHGIHINLYVAGFMSESKHIGCIIKIKDAKQPINPMLMSYSITHPSFFRRHCFRWLETTELATEEFVDGYGRVTRNRIGNDKMIDAMKRGTPMLNQRFKEAVYMDCESVSRANSIDDLLNSVNLNIK